MKNMFKQNHRRSIRLHGYDYSQNGMYYITLCIQNHLCLLGKINDHVMVHNNAGSMINTWWHKIPKKFPDIVLDEFIIMPNHFHAIIINNGSVGADPCVCPFPKPCVCPNNSQIINLLKTHDIFQKRDTSQKYDVSRFIGIEGEHMGSHLHRVVQWFKTMTTNEYIRNVKTIGWPSFNCKLWQRNYYEHIIRDYDSYQRIKKYIIDNPMNWG
jgi:putative transposase